MRGEERGCTIVTVAWDSHVPLLPGLIERVEPFREALAARSEAAHLVVVDNASTTELSAEGARIVKLARRGTIGSARNAGLLKVETDVVCYLDLDDRVEAESLLEIYEALREAPAEVAGICGRFERLDPIGGRLLGAWPHWWARALTRYPRGFSLLSLFLNELPLAQGAMVRTWTLRKAGGFADLPYGEDWVAGARLAHVGSIRFHSTARPALYTAGSLSRRSGTREVLAAYEGVRRALLVSPAIGKLRRAFLLLAGGVVNRMRAAREGRA